MRVGTTSDGAKEFRGWHDTVRNEDCYFRLASDGKNRCMPPAAALSYFAESSCTTPITILPITACTVTPGYVYVPSSDTCSPPSDLWQGQTLPTAGVFFKSGTSCTDGSTTYPATSWLRVGQGMRIAPSVFQESTEDIE
jgi:hypothetical protein